MQEGAKGELPLPTPPAASTSPFGRSVAVWLPRAVVMLPLTAHLPVAGLYSSALVREPVALPPPATSISPFASSVAVWPARAVVMLPAGVQVLELPRAGTAVLTISPMANNPANTSFRIAPDLSMFTRVMVTSNGKMDRRKVHARMIAGLSNFSCHGVVKCLSYLE